MRFHTVLPAVALILASTLTHAEPLLEEAAVPPPNTTDPVQQAGDSAALASTVPESLPVDTVGADPSPADIEPPAIDGMFDIAFSNGDFGSFDIGETAGGYRFIASFRLEKFGDEHFSLAPEVGYFRLGNVEQHVSVSVRNPPNFQGYEQTTTTTASLDTTSLDFGVRLGSMMTEKWEGFVRGGLGFHHQSREQQDSYKYTRLVPELDELPPTAGKTSANAESGVSPYAALGAAIKLGDIPSLYGEYGLRIINGNHVETLAVGFLLNF